MFLQSCSCSCSCSTCAAANPLAVPIPSQPFFRQFFFVSLCRRQLLCIVLQLDTRTGCSIGGQPRQWKRQLLRPFAANTGSDSVHVRQVVRSDFFIWFFLGLSMQPRIGVKWIPQRPVHSRSRWLRFFFEGCLFLQSCTAATLLAAAATPLAVPIPIPALFRQFFLVYVC